jgi:hypothetical protein
LIAALLEIHQNDSNFLPKFISYFDGEKDPRNLMIVFGILNVIMTEWDASSCAQVRNELKSFEDEVDDIRNYLMLLLITFQSHFVHLLMILTKSLHKI